MHRLSEMKSYAKRFLLVVFVLGLALSWSDMQASQTRLADEVHSSDEREQSASSGRRPPVRVFQKRERAEIWGVSDLSGNSLRTPSSELSVSPSSRPSSRGTTGDAVESVSSSAASGGASSSSPDSTVCEDERSTRNVSHRSSRTVQTYALPTHDGSFKYLLSHEHMLQSFLDAFITMRKLRWSSF